MSYDNSLQPKEARKKGQEIREAYVSAIEGLSDLLRAVSNKATNGWLLAIDGRRVLVDSPHKALKLFTSMFSWYCCETLDGYSKCWTKKVFTLINLRSFMTNCSFECRPYEAFGVKSILEDSARLAGEYYQLRCPIAAEAKED